MRMIRSQFAILRASAFKVSNICLLNILCPKFLAVTIHITNISLDLFKKTKIGHELSKLSQSII